MLLYNGNANLRDKLTFVYVEPAPVIITSGKLRF